MIVRLALGTVKNYKNISKYCYVASLYTRLDATAKEFVNKGCAQKTGTDSLRQPVA